MRVEVESVSPSNLFPFLPFEFDPDDYEYTKNPYPVYQYLRERAPAYYWAKADAWIFSRYRDVVAIMRDPRFSLNFRDWEHDQPTPERDRSDYERLMANGLFALPTADHTRVRKLVSPAFTPRAIERMRVDVQAIVDDMLAAIDPHQPVFDIVDGFAEQIPMRTIATILRIPRELDHAFRRFGTTVLDAFNPRMTAEERARVLEPFPAGLQLMTEVIEERRHHPGDDVLSTLIHAEEAGDRLSHDELLSLVMSLIVGGSETTVHLICYAVATLLRHPDQLALLRQSPELVRGALDEVLRYDSFGKLGLSRFAREDLEMGGVKLRKGQMIYPLLPAAMRDPEAFPDADRFDIRRDQTANISFGTGAHHCLGAALARLEGRVAIGTLVERFPDLRLAGEPAFGTHAFLRRMRSLPVYLR